MKSYSGMALKPITSDLIRRGKFRHRYPGRMPCDDRGRDWTSVSKSQGKPRIAGNRPKLEEARKASSLVPSEGEWPYRHFDFGILASRIVRE